MRHLYEVFRLKLDHRLTLSGEQLPVSLARSRANLGIGDESHRERALLSIKAVLNVAQAGRVALFPGILFENRAEIFIDGLGHDPRPFRVRVNPVGQIEPLHSRYAFEEEGDERDIVFAR